MNKVQQQSAREILKRLESARNGCVYVLRDRIRWSFYIHQGKIIYATHSLDGFERLERHLRGFSREVPALDDKLRSQLRLMFDDPSPASTKQKVTSEILCIEYTAILWLVKENYLTRMMASKLVARIIQEVFESFLCLSDGEFKVMFFEHFLKEMYCSLAIERILAVVNQRLEAWHNLGPMVCSPYQGLYLVSTKKAELRMPPETLKKLGRLLRGFNFCQLGAMLSKDPLAIAKQLSPLIADGSILLREPLPPFDMLPNTYRPKSPDLTEVNNFELLANTQNNLQNNLQNNQFGEQVNRFDSKLDSPNKKAFTDELSKPEPITEVIHDPIISQVSNQFSERSSEQSNADDVSSISQVLDHQSSKIWKIVCIDDSESMLSIINSYLGNEDFQVTLIQDSMKALMKITSINPDLILLDIGMPNVDGYQLCSLIRKSSSLKDIPIVMVTGNKGLIDRARARLAGATDYLTKPFFQADLLKMTMRHLM